MRRARMVLPISLSCLSFCSIAAPPFHIRHFAMNTLHLFLIVTENAIIIAMNTLQKEKAAGGTLLLIRPVKESGFLKKGLHVFNLFLIQVFYVLDEVDSRRRQPDILRLV